MKFKSLSVFLSLLIITVLPFTAYADGPAASGGGKPTKVGPAGDDSGSPVLATDDAPYVTAEITDDDRGHIATTAYVKGAYNNAIMGINASNHSLYEYINDVFAHTDNKRVEIYTTWGGNGTRDVELKNAE